MANITPQNIKPSETGESGMAYSGAMALDKTEKTNDTYNDWMKYLIPQTEGQQFDTQVKQFDQNQYMVEHQADAPQDPITPKIAETAPALTIGGKQELKPDFNGKTEVKRNVSSPELKPNTQTEVKTVVQQEITASPQREIPISLASKQPTEKSESSGIGAKLKEFDIDFGLFNEELVAPTVKVVKETVTGFFSAFKELITTYVLWREVKPKTEEEKKKEATEAANKRSFYGSLKTAMMQIFARSAKRKALQGRIQEVNRQVGNQNLNYEGILNENDEIRDEVLMAAEKANSEKSKEQIATDKRRRMLSATGSSQKKGPGITMSQDLAHNANNAAKLAG